MPSFHKNSRTASLNTPYPHFSLIPLPFPSLSPPSTLSVRRLCSTGENTIEHVGHLFELSTLFCQTPVIAAKMAEAVSIAVKLVEGAYKLKTNIDQVCTIPYAHTTVNWGAKSFIRIRKIFVISLPVWSDRLPISKNWGKSTSEIVLRNSTLCCAGWRSMQLLWKPSVLF